MESAKSERKASLASESLLKFGSAVAKRVTAERQLRPTGLRIGSVGVSGVGSGLVSWRGNGTSVGVGFYDPPGNL